MRSPEPHECAGNSGVDGCEVKRRVELLIEIEKLYGPLYRLLEVLFGRICRFLSQDQIIDHHLHAVETIDHRVTMALDGLLQDGFEGATLRLLASHGLLVSFTGPATNKLLQLQAFLSFQERTCTWSIGRR